MADRSFAAALRALRDAAYRFDETGRTAAAQGLADLAALPLPAVPALARYHDLLLFLRAHPPDAPGLRHIESELRRLARHVKALPAAAREALVNEGLPHGDTLTRFSHDAVRRLLRRADLRVQLDHVGEPRLDLNAVLRLTLPAPEWSHTTAGLGDDALLAALRVPPAARLRFLVDELERLDDRPFVKDHLFDALDLFVRVTPRTAAFSKAQSRLPMPAVYFQHDRLKRFDTLALMNRRLPRPRAGAAWGEAGREQAVRTIRDALTLTARETDPGTYLDERTLRVFDLERGISVAIFGMTPERQLPYESYVGFMLFKNGLAAAYGGAWVFGARADFGMNIFEPYRGGESGFMMCQVLRAYRQAFAVRHFEVDAHQFGLDNPDGIASGAFWFYHRHGFRPVDAALARLAERESRRLAATPGARSSEKTLRAFTGSSVALHFGGAVPVALPALGERITAMIARRFGGDRRAAEQAAIAGLARQGCALRAAAAPGAQRVVAEMALLAAALRVTDAPRLAALRRLVRLKPRDVFGYQRALLRFLGQA
jgi:hypothetical protein